MAEIELVIKIDEEQYKFIKQSMTIDKVKDYHALLYDICERIKDGTPLPENHGRLIDADNLFTWFDGECKTKYPIKDGKQYQTIMMYEVFDEIDDALTILEGTKKEKWISVAEAWMMEELETQIKEGKGCLGEDEK